MNLLLHGLEGEIKQGDTIQNPKFKNPDDTIETFDVVLANFPFSVENWAGNGTPKKTRKVRQYLIMMARLNTITPPKIPMLTPTTA